MLKHTRDTIIFMTAYGIHNLKHKFHIFHKKKNIKDLLLKHHIEGISCEDLYISRKGKISYKMIYDTVSQTSKYEFDDNLKKMVDVDSDFIDKMMSVLSIYHTAQLLLDTSQIDISMCFNLESFLVMLNDKIYQVDPLAFYFNEAIIVNYELIDFETSDPLDRNSIYGRANDFNILKVDKFKYFTDEDFINRGEKISDIIFENLISFLNELVNNKLEIDDYTFVHNKLVLSNNINNAQSYFQNVLNIDIPDYNIKNISTVNKYKYFSAESMGIVTDIKTDNISKILNDTLVLESLKVFLLLNMILDYNVHQELNEVIDNQIRIKSLFYPLNVPIVTENMIDNLKRTPSFTKFEQAVNYKIDTLKIYQERSKAENGRLMNILLYILAVFGSVQTLQILDDNFNISIRITIWITTAVFLIAGIRWFITDNKNK